MESKHVSWEDVSRKAREIDEREDARLLEKKEFENRCDELHNRFWQMGQTVEYETDIMFQILKQFSASADDVREYFAQMQDIANQSEQAYKRRAAELEAEGDEQEKAFRRELNKLEEEYDQLRRDYANSDD